MDFETIGTERLELTQGEKKRLLERRMGFWRVIWSLLCWCAHERSFLEIGERSGW